MSEPKYTGAGARRSEPLPAFKETPLSTLQKAQRALASQSRAQTLAEALTEEQRAALAATLDENDLATADVEDADGEVVVPGTAAVVRRVVDEFYDSQKAAVDED
jgi:hypothetical protein